MRTAIVYNGLVERAGGVPGHIQLLRRDLTQYGHQVDVLSMETVPPLCRYLTWGLQRTLNWLRPPLGHLVRCKLSGPLLERVYQRRAKRASYQGVVFETLCCCFPTGCPSVCVLHALLSDNLQAHRVSAQALDQVRRFEGQLLATCPARVVTTSEPYRDWILKSLGPHLPSGWDRLGVVPLGVDTEAFAPSPQRPSPATELRLLYVGILEARKNLPFALKVAQRVLLPRPQAMLTLIGSGPEERSLKREVTSLGLTRQVRFLGELSPARVAQEMPRHHLLLLPSLKESFAHVLLEAKLAGLVTLATAGLEVPPAFCDYSLPLETELWVKQIETVEGDWQSVQNSAQVESLRQAYSSRRVAQDLHRYLEN